MDRSDAVLRAGTMCTRRAASGNVGKSRSASCVEYIIVPLGLAMPMGLVVGRLLMTVAEIVQKCAVLPLSAMARASGGMIVGGGPTTTVDKLKSETLVSLKTLCGIRVDARVERIGSPRRQLVEADAGVVEVES
jgi:hypothetical protein